MRNLLIQKMQEIQDEKNQYSKAMAVNWGDEPDDPYTPGTIPDTTNQTDEQLLETFTDFIFDNSGPTG